MKLVSSRYIGRLGNNMFQVAAAIGYANLYGCKWQCNPTNPEVPGWFDFFPNLPRGNPPGNSYQCHDPKTFNFKKIPFQGSVQLMGFFQSEKYFKHCEDEVKEVFKLPVTEGMEEFCSIHVRRGDYVQYSADFPPITTEYISAAIREMMTGKGVTKFIVFSDDIPWCKKNIFSFGKGVELKFSEGRNEFEDMALMASCGNHIIANSSFSWWGAWLGVNRERHVISPRHKDWFGPNNGVTKAIGVPKDLIPDRWQQI